MRSTIRWSLLGLLIVLILAGCGESQPHPASSPDAAVPASQARDGAVAGSATDGDTTQDAAVAVDATPPPRVFARRLVANVYTEPRRSSSRIGYLRAGAVTRATATESAGQDGCLGGWYPIAAGGYVCNRRDIVLFRGTRLPERRSRQPDRADPLPYEYARMFRQKAPLYRRLPSDDEAEIYEPRRTPRPVASAPADGGPARIASSDAAVSPTRVASSDAAVTPTPTPTPATVESEPGGSPQAAVAAVVQPNVEAASAPGEAETDAGGPTLAGLQGDRGSVLQRWMLMGFFVSLDTVMSSGTRRYYRTQANGFLPVRSLRRVRGSDFSGLEIDGETWAFPIGYVMDRRAAWYERRPNGSVRRARGLPGFRHPFRIVGEETIRGREYLIDPEGKLYLASDVRRIDSTEPPEGMGDEERWLDVDLSRQSLVAYEGANPIFLTLISSGKRFRRGDEENFETPTGTFRISAKHVTDTMDGDSAMDGPYSIDDVPYVMYFRGAYAIHSAFWHNRFGRPQKPWLYQRLTARRPMALSLDDAHGARFMAWGLSPWRCPGYDGRDPRRDARSALDRWKFALYCRARKRSFAPAPA